MTEAAEIRSLAARARRLTALSRAKSENAKETQEQGKAETALNGLKAELAKFETVLATHRKLRVVGAPVTTPPDLHPSIRKLLDHLESTGRPTHQFLNARKADISRAAADIATQNQQAWRTWAKGEIEKLPVTVLPKLNLGDRRQAMSKIEALKKMAATSQASRSDVTIFRSDVATLAELLADVGATVADGVLSRFVGDRILLCLLSDQDLAILRGDDALKDQLYVVIS